MADTTFVIGNNSYQPLSDVFVDFVSTLVHAALMSSISPLGKNVFINKARHMPVILLILPCGIYDGRIALV